MNILALDVWEPEQVRESFLSRIKIENPDKVILFGQNELRYYENTAFRNLDKTIELLKSRGQTLYITTCAFPHKQEPILSNVKVYHWIDWFFKKAFNTCIFIEKDYSGSNFAEFGYYKQSLSRHKFKHYFTSLNYRSHKHRCLMIDLMEKNNLLEGNAVAWHHLIQKNNYGWAETYDWKYFKPRPLVLSNNFSDDWMLIPNQYFDSFAQIVSESSSDISLFSEKTVMAIICHKPFLICSTPYIHHKLKDLGFELYDEIFDYSFDTEEDDEIRYQLALENLVRLQKENSLDDLSNLLKKIKPKLIYNFEQLKKIAYDFDTIPEVAKEVIDIYNTTGIDHCQSLNGVIESLTFHKNDFI